MSEFQQKLQGMKERMTQKAAQEQQVLFDKLDEAQKEKDKAIRDVNNLFVYVQPLLSQIQKDYLEGSGELTVDDQEFLCEVTLKWDFETVRDDGHVRDLKYKRIICKAGLGIQIEVGREYPRRFDPDKESWLGELEDFLVDSIETNKVQCRDYKNFDKSYCGESPDDYGGMVPL